MLRISNLRNNNTKKSFLKKLQKKIIHKIIKERFIFLNEVFVDFFKYISIFQSLLIIFQFSFMNFVQGCE